MSKLHCIATLVRKCKDVVIRSGLINSVHTCLFILFIVYIKLFHAIGRLTLMGTEHELCLNFCSVGINIVYQLVVLLRFGRNSLFITHSDSRNRSSYTEV